jgi:hypothetical protein
VADQDHLFDDVETHLTHSTTTLQNWLNTYQGLFSDSFSKAKRLTLQGIPSILSYFAPAKRKTTFALHASSMPGMWVNCSQ